MAGSLTDRSGISIRCEVCGCTTTNSIRVTYGGVTHIFDSYQCAIHRLAAECEHCGCRILGRSLVAQERHYCSPECLAAVKAPVARVYPIHLRDS